MGNSQRVERYAKIVEDVFGNEDIQCARDAALIPLLDDMLKHIQPRHRYYGKSTRAEVLSMYYGLGEWGSRHRFVDIGRTVGFTGNRASQLVSDGLRSLRHPRHSRALREFLVSEGLDG